MLSFSWLNRIPPHWVMNVATLGPLGKIGRAPGTIGSIAGLVIYTLFFYPLPGITYSILLVATICIAAGICGQAERMCQQKDPSCIILDECVAMPLCFMGLDWAMKAYPMWLILLAGLALFRFFDILKPLGISYLQQFDGGWGVIVDDVAAALATTFVLHLGLLFLG